LKQSRLYFRGKRFVFLQVVYYLSNDGIDKYDISYFLPHISHGGNEKRMSITTQRYHCSVSPYYYLVL